jgi:hypothetical protein
MNEGRPGAGQVLSLVRPWQSVVGSMAGTAFGLLPKLGVSLSDDIEMPC